MNCARYSFWAIGLVTAVGQCIAADRHPLNPDALAYKNAVQALFDSKAGSKDAEIFWSKSLGVLATTKSSKGDAYLARLATFSLDGAYAEEYGCAIEKRGPELIQSMKAQQRQLSAGSDCVKQVKRRKLVDEGFCATKAQFNSTLLLAMEMKKPGVSLSGEPCGFETTEPKGSE